MKSMKNWVKYIFMSIFFLLLLAGGKFYPKTSLNNNVSLHQLSSSKNIEGSQILNLDHAINLDDILLEINEEDSNHLGHMNDYILESNLYSAIQKNFYPPFIWKKVEFKNKELISLQYRIFILIRNLRI